MFDLTLSFDNGPTEDVTPLVLDVLARREVKTTFFVIGEKLVQPGNRRHAERAHAEGHWIGNHTWSHSLPFGLMEVDAAKAEFDRTQNAIGVLVHPRRFFRPYGQGGNLDQRLLSRAVAGTIGSTLVVNLAGSPGACRDGYAVLRPALTHALKLLADQATATDHQNT